MMHDPIEVMAYGPKNDWRVARYRLPVFGEQLHVQKYARLTYEPFKAWHSVETIDTPQGPSPRVLNQAIRSMWNWADLGPRASWSSKNWMLRRDDATGVTP